MTIKRDPRLQEAAERVGRGAAFKPLVAWIEDRHRSAVRAVLRHAEPVEIYRSQGYAAAMRELLQLLGVWDEQERSKT